MAVSDDSDEEADLSFSRYVSPSRTIVVVADEERPPKPEMLGVLIHTLTDIPHKYRFAVDAMESLLIIYPDGTCVAASDSRAGKKWLSKLKVKA